MRQRRDHLPVDARLGAVVLGAGALGFGLLGILAPGRLARMMGIDDDAARAVGFRDVGNAIAFALAPTRAAAAQRMLYDLGDALVFGRRKPAVAVGATSFAALAAWTAWRAR
ncbi:MAG: hypothetical protein ACRDNI_04815 [Gaiellaceae bacterium]